MLQREDELSKEEKEEAESLYEHEMLGVYEDDFVPRFMPSDHSLPPNFPPYYGYVKLFH